MDGQAGPAANPGTVRIGDWLFDSRAQTLQSPERKVRLEHRAARLLALFASRPGQVVTREEIVEAIWAGRSLSPNSTAVVISDLRRALGDDARKPRFIETVPKRGYRMPAPMVRSGASGPPASANAQRGSPARRRAPLLAALGLALILAALALVAGMRLWSAEANAPAVVVTINNVRNETGQPRFDDTARTISEIGVAYLGAANVPVLVRDRWDFDAEDPSRGLYEDFGEDARVHHISSTIVMDDETPRLIMFANEPRTNQVVWSYESGLPDGSVRETVHAALADFLVEAGLEPG